MEHPPTLSDLIAKRAKQIRRLHEYCNCVAEIKADIAAIETTMQRYAPPQHLRAVTDGIPPSISDLHRRSALRLIINTLRQFGRPASAQEIASAIVRQTYWNNADSDKLLKRLLDVLRRGTAPGFVLKIVGPNGSCLWDVGPTPLHGSALFFQSGKALLVITDVLRELGKPSTTQEIAARIATRQNLAFDELSPLEISINQALRKARRVGIVHFFDNKWNLGLTPLPAGRTLYFKPNEALGLTITALHELGRPADIKEIAFLIANKKGLDPKDIPGIEQSLYGILKRGVDQNRIELTDPTVYGLRWRLPQIKTGGASKLRHHSKPFMSLAP